MAYIASHHPDKGMCKKTAKALRWLVFLGFSLVTLVMLAQFEHQLKLEQTGYGEIAAQHGQAASRSMAPFSLQ